jgi:hypothetical protein
MKLLSICGALILMAYIPASAGDKTLMHCFAWTPIKEATPADWDAFYKASDALPKKIKGIIRVWYGKLANPLSQIGLGQLDPATSQKYQAGESVTAPIRRNQREYGMCMEMKDADVRKAYATDPYHKIWDDAYAKVHVEGTTTFDILGQ